MSIRIKLPALVISLFISFTALQSQTVLKSDKNSKIYIEGTSSLHDWKSDVEAISGQGEFVFESGIVTRINSLSISIPVESIKSGKGGMDKSTYEALKYKKFPSINFTLVSATSNGNNLSSSGKLTIADVTKTIQLNPEITSSTLSKVVCKGSVTIDMTDYGIVPPTAMLGTIKTGKDVTIHFEVSFSN